MAMLECLECRVAAVSAAQLARDKDLQQAAAFAERSERAWAAERVEVRRLVCRTCKRVRAWWFYAELQERRGSVHG